ncbi:hypothetical protein BJ166DRAFT_188978 [Pestalotiopsis sp. NC0098]|nr:hypothetical protein BJ166DRAFT_188978 [Pestalotiopsis sp. NC0098]
MSCHVSSKESPSSLAFLFGLFFRASISLQMCDAIHVTNNMNAGKLGHWYRVFPSLAQPYFCVHFGNAHTRSLYVAQRATAAIGSLPRGHRKVCRLHEAMTARKYHTVGKLFLSTYSVDAQPTCAASQT